MSFLRSSGLNAVIVIVLSLSWIIPAGASGVFVLKNIEVNSNDESVSYTHLTLPTKA